MKEYNEYELLHVPEAEFNTWVDKQAQATLKHGNGSVSGIIEKVEKSAIPNTPLSADFLCVGIKLDGKIFGINDIESLKIFK
jgi:hypothetical protein